VTLSSSHPVHLDQFFADLVSHGASWKWVEGSAGDPRHGWLPSTVGTSPAFNDELKAIHRLGEG